MLGMNVSTAGAFGFEAEFTNPQKVGLAFLINVTITDPSGKSSYYSNISQHTAEVVFNDWYRKSSYGKTAIVGGINFPVTKSILLTLGGGLGKLIEFRNYLDEFGILGDGGSYWIKGEEKEEIAMYSSVITKINRTSALNFFLISYPFQIGLGFTFSPKLSGLMR